MAGTVPSFVGSQPPIQFIFQSSQNHIANPDLGFSVPAIQDPNTNLTLWESGAIIEYLIDQYDTGNIISHSTFPEKYHAKQWLHFQMSGQGPYFGQAAWFSHFHPEKVPSAITRYRNEIKRVTMVLDKVLGDREYLVGDKCTYADLAFVTWYDAAPYCFADEEVDLAKEFPNYGAWMGRLLARPSVQRMLENKKKAKAEGR
jgi:glutathione S-transferase